MRVHLPHPLAARMLRLAQRGYPNEVCGLLAQEDTGAWVALLPIRNHSPQPTVHYRMEPMAQYLAFTEAEARGWRIAGIYHSHPHSAAYPSPADRAAAFDSEGAPCFPGYLYFILSLADPASPTLRAFRLPTPHGVDEVALLLV